MLKPVFTAAATTFILPTTYTNPAEETHDAIPAEAVLVASALSAAAGHLERRRGARAVLQARAILRLFSGKTQTAELFTRDLSGSTIGFVTRAHLPLGVRGRLTVARPDGDETTTACTVIRCRQVTPTWYEGGVMLCENLSACLV